MKRVLPRSRKCPKLLPFVAITAVTSLISCETRSQRPVGNTENSEQLLEWTAHGGLGRVEALAWSPDSHFVASGGDDSVVRVWNASTGRLQAEMTAHSDTISTLTFYDDESVLSGARDSLVIQWNWRTQKIVQKYYDNRDMVFAMAFDPVQRSLATGGHESLIRLRSNLEEQSTILAGHTNTIWSLAITDKAIFSGAADETVRKWDRATGNELWQRRCFGTVRCVAVSPDSGSLVVGDQGHVRVLDANDGSEKSHFDVGGGSIVSIAFLPNQPLLLIASELGGLSLVDTNNRQILPRPNVPIKNIASMSMAPRGDKIAIGTYDGKIHIIPITRLLHRVN
jgi:WD40 repeat protein